MAHDRKLQARQILLAHSRRPSPAPGGNRRLAAPRRGRRPSAEDGSLTMRRQEFTTSDFHGVLQRCRKLYEAFKTKTKQEDGGVKHARAARFTPFRFSHHPFCNGRL